MIDFGLMGIALKIAWIQRIRQNSDGHTRIRFEPSWWLYLFNRLPLRLKFTPATRPTSFLSFCVKVLARLQTYVF